MVDLTEGRERCTRRLAQSVRKNAKSLSNPAVIVRYTARSASQSAEIEAVKRQRLRAVLDPRHYLSGDVPF